MVSAAMTTFIKKAKLPKASYENILRRFSFYSIGIKESFRFDTNKKSKFEIKEKFVT